jgi:transglutaminase-like putative cysteine protease
MFAITGVTISRALAGSPATLSLAYFAALAQGLQLLDARPRKSEFLLVALALFQVILAANLTDSVFFPPLLVLFLIAVTWTLMVHTLGTEAAESGDASAARAALPPDLLRTTLLASLLSLLLAGVIFMVLPRMRSSVLRGGLGPGMAVSGFSDRVDLGTIGRIRKDRRVVLRVETLEGPAPAPGAGYWRGMAFDRFDGRSWSVSAQAGRAARERLNGTPRFGLELRGGPPAGARVERIVREPVEAGVLFTAGPLRRIEGPMDHLQLDNNGGLYFPARPNERIRYTLWTLPAPVATPALTRDHTAPSSERGPLAAERAARYTALPELDPAVAGLAREITAGLESDAARLAAIEAYLRRKGRYTDEPPPMGQPGGRSPVEDFLLGEVAGHCEYFASCMVVLARSLDMPARLVNGFAGGRINRIGGFTELLRADAHAWVEVHFAEAGWVRYDPTPPDLRSRSAAGLSLFEQLAELGSVIELWWFQRIVDFDSSDQVLALKSAWTFFKDLRPEPTLSAEPERRRTPEPGWRLPSVPGPVLLAGLFALGLLAETLRRRRGRDPAHRLPRAYARALRLLARRGLIRREATTAHGFVDEVTPHLPGAATAHLRVLTRAYLAERFGPNAARSSPGELTQHYKKLREALPRRPRNLSINT